MPTPALLVMSLISSILNTKPLSLMQSQTESHKRGRQVATLLLVEMQPIPSLFHYYIL